MTAYVDKVAVLRRERAVLLGEREQFAESGILTGSPPPKLQSHVVDLRRRIDARLTAIDLEIIELGGYPSE